MNRADETDTQDIVVDEVFPHAPEVLWRALTTPALMRRWMMEPKGFEPVEGHRFTFQTTPAGVWDGVIHCEVLEVIANERFAYSWKAGDDANPGYGSRLDTIVSFTLSRVVKGTRLRLVHSGFDPRRNDTALKNLGTGWSECVDRLSAVANDPAGGSSA